MTNHINWWRQDHQLIISLIWLDWIRYTCTFGGREEKREMMINSHSNKSTRPAFKELLLRTWLSNSQLQQSILTDRLIENSKFQLIIIPYRILSSLITLHSFCLILKYLPSICFSSRLHPVSSRLHYLDPSPGPLKAKLTLHFDRDDSKLWWIKSVFKQLFLN